MRRTCRMLALVCIAAGLVLAGGGFVITLEQPAAGAKDVVLLAKVAGCATADTIKLSGSAEGLVNGQRRSVPLNLMLTDGAYQVRRNWPSEGAWVLVLSGTKGNLASSTILTLGPGGAIQPKFAGGKMLPVKHTYSNNVSAEVETALRSVAAPTAEVATK